MMEALQDAGETSKLSETSEITTAAVEVKFIAAAEKDLDRIGNGKHLRQIVQKLDDLERDPHPADAKAIQGQQYRDRGWNLFRVDVGEYRIVYDLDEAKSALIIITVAVIAARNDDRVYRLLRRRFG